MEIKKLLDQDLSGSTVVMRVDFNCPVKTSSDGVVNLNDFKRIDDHLDNTIAKLFDMEKAPKNVVLLAHQGRPGHMDCITLREHFERCRSKLQPLGIKTFYVWEETGEDKIKARGEDAVSGKKVKERILRLNEISDRSVLLLENVRFSEHEDSSDGSIESFAKAPLIKMLGEIGGVVDRLVVALDGFSVAHRAQASVIGLANLGHLYAGPVVLREIEQLSLAVESPMEPVVLVVGGGKVDDSLHSVERFLRDKKAHKVLAGGLVGMAFLLADRNFGVNQRTEDNIRRATKDFDQTRKVCNQLRQRFRNEILVPSDVAIKDGQDRRNMALSEAIRQQEEFGDIGIETIGRYISELAAARTIIMNGPVGRYENTAMAFGTTEILRYAGLVAREKKALALIGGGDTSAAVRNVEHNHDLKQCSSGKAFLEVITAGSVDTLVGIRALKRPSKVEHEPGLRVVGQNRNTA